MIHVVYMKIQEHEIEEHTYGIYDKRQGEERSYD